MQLLTRLSRTPRAAQSATTILPGQLVLSLAALAVVSFLCGCAGAVSANSNSSSPPSTFTISGTVSPATAGNGATLALSGKSSASATADASGNYSFSNLTNGGYVVTPSRSGYSFSPALQSVTINGANDTGVNFAGSQQTPHSVGLSWQASTSTVSGYNIYRATTNGGPYSKMNSGLITALSYTDTNVSSATTYYYVSTAVDSAGLESAYSNQATAAIP
jgi:hypothetical protein